MLDQSTVCLRPVYFYFYRPFKQQSKSNIADVRPVYFYFYRPLKQQSKSNIADVRPVYCMSKTSIFLFL